MNKIKLITWISSILVCSFTFGQDEITQFNFWKYYSDVENSLYKHFCSVAFDQLEGRKAEIQKLETREDWLARQSHILERFREIIGPFPEKTPLNVQITGKLRKDGYTIEKIIYESTPGYYIPGALYIPDGIEEKAPAIFYTCGHSLEGFRVNTYQHIIINLVKKGFVVFTIDPMGQGERYEYWDQEINESLFPVPDHEHSYAGAQCLISGYSTARYFIWDLIRGIDFMLTRKEIDPDRIGMTGRSGGGNTTAYLGAVDDRILATAPECYITSYEEIYKSIGPQCAEQNLYHMIWEGLDHADFIEARAPKPTMIISTSRDFFSIQGAMDSFEEAMKMYKTLGMEQNLVMAIDDTVHKSTRKNREAMYAFFQKHLNNPGDPAELDVVVPDLEELQVTRTGQVVTAFEGQSVFSLNREIVNNQLDNLNEKRTEKDEFLREIPVSAAKHSGFIYPAAYDRPVFSGRYVRSDYILEKYLLPGSGDYVLPMTLLKPAHQAGDKIILLLDSKGVEHAVYTDSLAYSLVKNGYTVLLMDLPGIGILGPGYMKGDSYIHGVSYNQWFAAVLAGKSNVGLRAEDLVRVVHFIKNDLKTYSYITACATGPLGSELLHAATFEPDINEICLVRSFLSYADIALTRFYKASYIPFTVAGAINDYDLTDLIAGLCPRKVLIVDPLSGDGKILHDEKIEENIKFPSKVYHEKSVPENLNVINVEDNRQLLDHILSWLDK
jgi:hypothetical protein